MDIMSFITQPQVMITLAVLILLLWRISYGYKYGLIAELLEIAALAVGFCILNITSSTLDKLLHGGNLNIVSIVVKLVVVVAIYRAIQGVSNGTKGVRKIPIVGSADQLLGVCFGFIEIYMWIRLLNFIIGYDFEGAIRYTVQSVIGMIKGVWM